MSAARAVLDTLEVLENIIVNVPAYQIPGLKQVSTLWNQLIETSPCIQKALCLVPTAYLGQVHPIYAVALALRKNPNLPWVFVDISPRSGYKLFFHIRPIGPSRLAFLQAFPDEYLTFPRCQQAALQLRGENILFIAQCILRVKGGIKIGDVYDSIDALWRTHTRYLSHELRDDSYFECSLSFVERKYDNEVSGVIACKA